MKIVRTIGDLRAQPCDGTVGLVPTMGAFHAGHVALFDQARSENDTVVVSLFVNPAQFGAGEDLASYPRNEEADARVSEQAGVDILFVPTSGFKSAVNASTLVAAAGTAAIYHVPF